ncbi:MAG: hypothetical protein F6K09_06515 [Merismopedia sp. SIO2A8]|nr:hypothetical protein [Symploca sp. SIO2B6]NET48372.1 hypothetical protein [Merismopedia sp. SIO2A8]
MTLNQSVSQPLSVNQEFRAIVQRQRQKAKQRQQSMVSRLAAEIGK